MKCLSALFSAAFVGLAYMVSQGIITTTIVWFAITTGVTAGLGYCKEKRIIQRGFCEHSLFE
jgi:hypothetical protein